MRGVIGIRRRSWGGGHADQAVVVTCCETSGRF